MAGDAARQIEKGFEPAQLALAEHLHFHPAIGPADNRADGDDENVVQLMNDVPTARIAKALEKAQQRTGRLAIHGKLLVIETSDSKKRETSRPKK